MSAVLCRTAREPSGLVFTSEARFLAAQKPPDILAMHDENENCDQKREHRVGFETEQQHVKRREPRSDQCRERRHAPDECCADPCRGGKKPNRPIEREQDAERTRDTLAAFKSEPYGEQVTKDRAKRGDHRGIVTPIVTRNEGCGRALAGIENQSRDCGPALAGAQNIGGADIARADFAHIAGTRHPGEQKSKRNRTEQITDAKRDGGLRPDEHQRFFSFARSNTHSPPTKVILARPWNLRPSKGVLRARECRSAGSRTKGSSGSNSTMSAGVPFASLPLSSPRIRAGASVIVFRI